MNDFDKNLERISNILQILSYEILVTDTFKDLKPGESKSSTLYASKLLSNKLKEIL